MRPGHRIDPEEPGQIHRPAGGRNHVAETQYPLDRLELQGVDDAPQIEQEHLHEDLSLPPTRLAGRLSRASRMDPGANELDDVLRRGPRREDLQDAELLELSDVVVRYDSSREHRDVGPTPLLEQLDDP